MKRFIKLSCLALCIIMTLSAFAACNNSSNNGNTGGTPDTDQDGGNNDDNNGGNTDDSQNGGEDNKDEGQPGGNENDNQTGGNENDDQPGDSEGALIPLPQPDVAYFESAFYVDFSIKRREFSSDGKLVREIMMNDSSDYIADERVEYFYDDTGKLIRSEMHSKDLEMDDFTDGKYHLESYLLYSHDEEGRAISAIMYDEYGREQNVTATLEYYDSGELKKVSYFEKGEHEYSFEYDKSGRCVKEYKALVIVTRNYEGDSRVPVSAVANLNDEAATLYMSMNFAYDSEGNVSRVEIARGDATKAIAFEYLSEAEGGLVKKISTDTATVEIEYTPEGYLSKGTFKNSYSTISVDVEYYPCGAVKKRVYVYDNEEKDIDEYQIDANNNIVKHTENVYDGNDILTEYMIVDYVYDSNNNMTKRVRKTYNAVGELQSNYAYEYEYNSKGLETKNAEYRYGNDDVLDSVYTKYAPEYREDGTTRYKEDSVFYENGKPSSKNVRAYDYNKYENCIYDERVRYVVNEAGAYTFYSRSEEYTEYEDGRRVKSVTYTWYDEAKYLSGEKEEESVYEYTYTATGNSLKTTYTNKIDGKLNRFWCSQYSYDENQRVTGYTNNSTDYYENGNIMREVVEEYETVYTQTGSRTNCASKIIKEYNENGNIRQKEEKRYKEGSSEWEPSQVLYTYYGENGAVTGSRLYEYEYASNGMGDIIKTTCTEYDANGNVVNSWQS